MRTAEIVRKTKETDIVLTLNLDGKGIADIDSGNGFFDHMLTLFTAHSKIDLSLKCKGDVNVDFHHSAEDIGIALGSAFQTALADKKGINRYGDIILPMDEALIMVACDFGGRCFLSYDVPLKATRVSDDAKEQAPLVGSFDTELVEEFFYAFTRNAEMNLHIKKLNGTNTHHILEGVFKAFARCVRQAKTLDKEFAEDIPSTKGSL